jgi:prophage maintenance system killer protein
METKGEIILFKSGKEINLEVKLQEETVWLNQKQMAILFDKDSDTVGLHIKNIFKEKELNKKSTTEYYSVVQQEGKRSVKRKIIHYNLDVIISVGYRVKSQRGTQFRIWANKVLKEYLVKGYALNRKRLTETKEKLNEVTENIKMLGRIIKQQQLSENENLAFLRLISDYAFALDLLDKYDHQTIEEIKSKSKSIYKIELKEALNAISEFKKETKATDLFAKQKDKSFESSLNTIYQTYGGKQLYPSLEDKAANLLYFVVKNHSFVDGNKRIGAFLFIWFLNKNNYLFTGDGIRRISNETLVALTIMIAESNPKEKELVIKLIKHILQSGES